MREEQIKIIKNKTKMPISCSCPGGTPRLRETDTHTNTQHAILELHRSGATQRKSPAAVAGGASDPSEVITLQLDA